jgi:nickel transport protein
MTNEQSPMTNHQKSAAILVLAASTMMTGRAEAHRLEADYHLLPDHRIQIESWFDLTGESPRGARVQVFAADGDLVTEGSLNADGIFVFGYGADQSLRIVVSAGEGHRKELTIPAEALGSRPAGSGHGRGTANPSPSVDAPVPLSDRSPRTSLKDLLLGIALILSAAAFLLSVRNRRLLRQLLGH